MDALILQTALELDNALNKSKKGLVLWDKTNIREIRTYVAYIHSAWQVLLEAFYADRIRIPSGIAPENLNYTTFYTRSSEEEVMPWLCAALGAEFISLAQPQKTDISSAANTGLREALEIVRQCIIKDGDLSKDSK